METKSIVFSVVETQNLWLYQTRNAQRQQDSIILYDVGVKVFEQKPILFLSLKLKSVIVLQVPNDIGEFASQGLGKLAKLKLCLCFAHKLKDLLDGPFFWVFNKYFKVVIESLV